jgi:hypothetical protein
MEIHLLPCVYSVYHTTCIHDENNGKMLLFFGELIY